MKNTGSGAPVAQVALFYACDSLTRQIAQWARQRSGCAVHGSVARLLPEIRAVLAGADFALIDATDDQFQAADAFAQAARELGAGATAVYTERMHDGLELLVRSRGTQLLLGPLAEAEWDAFFARALPSPRRRSWGKVA